MATASRPVITETTAPSFEKEELLASLPLKQRDINNESKATVDTQDTVSTADDSLTMSVSVGSYASSRQRLFGPPMANVNVDTRGVRQRLREQEAKINALLHSKPTNSSESEGATAAPSEGVLLTLIDTLESDLKKTQAEKVQLQQDLEELARLGGTDVVVTDEDESIISLATFPSQRVAGARTTAQGYPTASNVSDQDERVAQLEELVRRKTDHLALMHDRWESTVRRMVTYQCELETHDLHLTQYAAEQDEAGQEALAELHDLTRKGQPKEVRHIGKKAKKMMSSLLNDLEALAARYQEARVSHEQSMAEVRQSQGQWQRRAQKAEARLHQEGMDVQDDDDDEATFLEFHEKLSFQESAAQQAQKELGAKLRASQWEVEQSQVEKDVLRKEIQRLQRTVSQLQGVTQKQQDALEAAEKAAAVVAAAAAAPQKKKLFSFKKNKPATARPVLSSPPLEPVDVAAALVPMQHESQRFDVLHERMRGQRQVLLQMQADLHKEMRQKKQLARTVADLRVKQEHVAANATANEPAAVVLELQDQLRKLEAQRNQEQQQALETIQELQYRLGGSVEC